MVIGSLFFRRGLSPIVTIALALSCLTFRAVADDQIVKKDGTVIAGTVISIVGTQVMVKTVTSRGGEAKVPYQLSDIKSVTMATPPAVVKAEAPETAPGAVVGALEPQVKQFAGLPADWIVDAMARLAEAYLALNQADKALGIYDEIDTLYPGSKYHAQAVAGKADMSLKVGKFDEALAAVQPIVDEANRNIAPSPAEGAAYAHAFLVYGSVLEMQKKPQEALEAYLTVKTMFYQNSSLVFEAERRAKVLRDKNPGIGID
jgi:tetratricopeptide (TPR) repeat protein